MKRILNKQRITKMFKKLGNEIDVYAKAKNGGKKLSTIFQHETLEKAKITFFQIQTFISSFFFVLSFHRNLLWCQI